MVIPSLSLDDALENSPQTQCLLKVFEEDTSLLSAFAAQLQTHLELLVAAQSDVAASLEQLAKFLGSYGGVQFPLERGNRELGDIIRKFQGTMSELGSWMELMVQQMQNCVLYPVNKLLDRLNESQRCKGDYYEAYQNLNLAVMKMLRLNRKESPKKLEDANADYGASRRNFHKASLQYFVVLNALQYQRNIALIEPLLSIVYAYRSLFRMGDQALGQSVELPQFFTRVQEQIHSFHVEQQTDASTSQEYLKSMEEIMRIQPHMYEADDGSSAGPVDDKLRHKQGYLFFKTKSGLLTKWEQYYFYTENGSLLCQGKDEIGSQVLLELNESVHAVETEHEDRRNCFLIISGDKKRQFCFQAVGVRDCKEWITAVNNIVACGISAFEKQADEVAAAPSVIAEEESDVQVAVDVQAGSAEGEDDFSSAPIQFDMFAPVEETCVANGLTTFDDLAQRSAEFSAKFLGCVEVSTDRKETTARDAIRRVTRARMMHNIIRALDAKIVVVKRPAELRLVDPQSLALKALYPMEQIAYWTADESNERMFAFIVRQKGDRSASQRSQYVCHVFESTGTETAEEICNVLGEAVKSALQAVQ